MKIILRSILSIFVLLTLGIALLPAPSAQGEIAPFPHVQPLFSTTAYTSTVVKVTMTTLTPSLCDKSTQGVISLNNVSGVSAVRLEVGFDPNLLQVIDANPSQAGIQVKTAGIFATASSFITQNEVDNTKGIIYFAATLGKNVFTGTTDLFMADWQLQNAGKTGVILRNGTLAGTDGVALNAIMEDSMLEILSVCDTVAGVVTLQGRQDHHGITITDALGNKTTTDATGKFNFSGGVSIAASYPGYLTAMTDVPPAIASNIPINLGRVTLLAGDVKADNVINIFDLTYMAGRMNTNDSLADLNGDGLVNIFDLTLAAGNYQKQGPLTNWQK